jgi:CHAT domain-containing protein
MRAPIQLLCFIACFASCSLLPGQDPGYFENQNRELEAAIDLYYQSDYQAGSAALKNLYAERGNAQFTATDLARLQCYLAECYFEIGQEAQARTAFLLADDYLQRIPADVGYPPDAYRIPQGLLVTLEDEEAIEQQRQRLYAMVEGQDQPTPQAQSAVDHAKGMEAITAGDFPEAAQRFQAAVDVLSDSDTDLELSSAHNALAQTYYSVGDFTNALLAEQQALASCPPNHHYQLFRTYVNLAGRYLDLRLNEKARKILQETYLFNQQHAELAGSDRWPFYYACKVELHNSELEIDSMKIVLEQQTAFYQRHPDRTADNSYRRYLNQFAGYHIRKGNFTKADSLVKAALKLPTYPHFNSSAFLLTKVLCEQKAYGRAIDILRQLSCGYALIDFGDCVGLSMDSLLPPEQWETDFTLVEYTKDLASYYSQWYASAETDSLLLLSDQYIALADSMLFRLRIDGNYPGLERKIDEVSAEIRKVQLQNLYGRYEKQATEEVVEQALNASERSKQLSISERLHQQLLSLDFGLPTEVVERERRYANRIKELIDEIRLTPDSLRGERTKMLSEYKQLQDAHRADISEKYPRFYQLLYTPPVVSVEKVRSGILGEDEVFIEYQERNNHLYALLISAEEQLFFRLPLSESLDELVPTLLEGMRAKSSDVFPILRRLYQELIAPLEAHLGDHNLVIVPDGQLWYVPFAALLTEDQPERTVSAARKYLIQQRDIRYLISARQAQLQSVDTKKKYRAGILSLTPLTTDSIGHFPPLPASAETLALLSSLSNTRHDYFLSGKDAKASAFLRHASGAALLHIGTHTSIDDRRPEDSYLVFSGPDQRKLNPLRADEIYTLSLPAQLAVLSACSTGKGKIRRGQGVTNLARAFAHAGCRNLIVNLWEIKDRTSAALLQSFYPAIIKRGERTAAAFNNAQRDYLTREGSKAHPGFWATSIYIGANETIDLNSHPSAWWYIGAIALGTFIALIGLFTTLKKMEG